RRGDRPDNPFSEDGSVDFGALEALVERVTAGGADYLVVLGTTAETPTLTADEKEAVVMVASIRKTDFTGIDAILTVTPYYNKPSQEGIYQHYKAVAAAAPCGVVLYNVPGRTGVNMKAETVLRLAHDCPNVVAVKEASGCLSQAAYILRDRPEGFAVVSGDDNLTLPMVALGGDGIISVAAQAFPEKFCRMAHLALDGRVKEAASLHLQMMEAVDSLFEEGNPTGIKAALSCLGVIGNYLRLPLVPASDRLVSKIDGLLKAYELR
ncbi:unnamed protein product, partial [Mycena citricolor]